VENRSVGNRPLILPTLQAGVSVGKAHNASPSMVGTLDVKKTAAVSHSSDEAGKTNTVTIDIQKGENLAGIHARQMSRFGISVGCGIKPLGGGVGPGHEVVQRITANSPVMGAHEKRRTLVRRALVTLGGGDVSAMSEGRITRVGKHLCIRMDLTIDMSAAGDPGTLSSQVLYGIHVTIGNE